MDKYKEYIDFVKGIAITLVVIGHIIQVSLIGGGRQHPVYQWIYSYHMGVFFFCSGILTRWTDFYDGIQPIWRTIKKKTLRIVTPFLAWGLISFIQEDDSFTLSGFVDVVFIHPRYGLWFLRSLFVYSMVFIFISEVINAIKKHSKFLNDYILLSIGLLLLLISNNFAMFFLGTICGLSDKAQKLLSDKWVASIASILFFCSIFMDGLLPRQIVCLSAAIVLCNIGMYNLIPLKIKNEIVRFGKNSMPIFLIHPLILNGLSFTIPVNNDFCLFLACTVLTIILSYICLMLYMLADVGCLKLILFGEKN